LGGKYKALCVRLQHTLSQQYALCVRLQHTLSQQYAELQASMGARAARSLILDCLYAASTETRMVQFVLKNGCSVAAGKAPEKSGAYVADTSSEYAACIGTSGSNGDAAGGGRKRIIDENPVVREVIEQHLQEYLNQSGVFGGKAKVIKQAHQVLLSRQVRIGESAVRSYLETSAAEFQQCAAVASRAVAAAAEQQPGAEAIVLGLNTASEQPRAVPNESPTEPANEPPLKRPRTSDAVYVQSLVEGAAPLYQSAPAGAKSAVVRHLQSSLEHQGLSHGGIGALRKQLGRMQSSVHNMQSGGVLEAVVQQLAASYAGASRGCKQHVAQQVRELAPNASAMISGQLLRNKLLAASKIPLGNKETLQASCLQEVCSQPVASISEAHVRALLENAKPSAVRPALKVKTLAEATAAYHACLKDPPIHNCSSCLELKCGKDLKAMKASDLHKLLPEHRASLVPSTATGADRSMVQDMCMAVGITHHGQGTKPDPKQCDSHTSRKDQETAVRLTNDEHQQAVQDMVNGAPVNGEGENDPAEGSGADELTEGEDIDMVEADMMEAYGDEHHPDFKFCSTCKAKLQAGHIPAYSAFNDTCLPVWDVKLAECKGMYERLCALKIPFMQIRALARGEQKGLTGSVVNVPSNFEHIQLRLPKDDLPVNHTITVKLKRSLAFRRAAWTEGFQPHVWYRLMEVLKHKPLYEAAGIKAELSADNVEHHALHREDGSDAECQSNADSSEDMEEVVLNRDQQRAGKTGEDKQGEQHAADQVGEDNDQDNADSDAYSDEEVEGYVRKQFCSDMLVEGADAADRLEAALDTLKRKMKEQGLKAADPMQHEILELAPGEDKDAEGLVRDPDIEAKCFPRQFCGHADRQRDERPVPTSHQRLAAHRVKLMDPRVRDSTYIFFLIRRVQALKIWQEKRTAQRKSKCSFVPAWMVNTKQARERWAKDKSQEAHSLLRTLRLSPAYYDACRKGFLAQLRQLGKPTVYFTFSQASYSDENLQRTLYVLQHGHEPTEEQIKGLCSDFQKGCEAVRQDPVTVARMYDKRLKCFTEDVLMGCPSAVGQGMRDYLSMEEWQGRGDEHTHGLGWCADAPVFNDKDTPDERVIQWIDQNIKCDWDLPQFNLDPELIRVQLHHHHKGTCMKGRHKTCRFNMPRPPMPRTMILRPILDTEATQADMRRYHLMHKDIQIAMKEIGVGMDERAHPIQPKDKRTFDQFLADLGLKEDEYIMALRSQLRAPQYFKARRPCEVRINNYNPTLLGLTRANMDIQYVMDPYAAVMYITSYACKGDSSLNKLMQEVLKCSKDSNEVVTKTITSLGSAFLNCSTMCAQQAVSLLLGIPVMRSSRERRFIPAAPPDRRTTILKEPWQLAELEPESVDTFALSILDKYANRPLTMENMSLSYFCAYVNETCPKRDHAQLTQLRRKAREAMREEAEAAKKAAQHRRAGKDDDMAGRPAGDDTVCEEDEAHLGPEIHDGGDAADQAPANNAMDVEDECTGGLEAAEPDAPDPAPQPSPHTQHRYAKQYDFMSPEARQCKYAFRKYARIVYSPNFSMKTDPELRIRELYMLHVPWRDEEQLRPSEYDSWQAYWDVQENRDRLLNEHAKFEGMKEQELNKAQEDVDHYLHMEADLEGDIDPVRKAETQRLKNKQRIAEEYDLSADLAALDAEHGALADHDRGIFEFSHLQRAQDKVPEADFAQMVRSLNRGQRQYYNHVMHSIVKRRNRLSTQVEFLTGGAGTGKSHLVKAITQGARRLYEQMPDGAEDPDLPRVLLLGPTGISAYNIHGDTCHSAMRFQPRKEGYALSREALDQLTYQYKHVQMVIIDEISMVSSFLLHLLSDRLQKIKHNQGQEFGGLFVLLVGDLHQLRPVKGRLPFESQASKAEYTDLVDPENYIWRRARVKMYELTECMRQKDALEYVDVLNRLQVADSIEDLSHKNDRVNKGAALLKKMQDRQITDKSIRWIVYTNARKDALNNQYMRELERQGNDTIIVTADDHVHADVSGDTRDGVLRSAANKKARDMNGMYYHLRLAAGMPVEMVMNVNTRDGLTNGSAGVLRGWTLQDTQGKVYTVRQRQARGAADSDAADAIRTVGTPPSPPPPDALPIILWVEFYNPEVGKQAKKVLPRLRQNLTEDIPPRCVPIYAETRPCDVGYKKTTMRCTRTQFPLVAAYATTIHHAQGTTLEAGNVDMCDMNPNLVPAALYVALSRFTSPDRVTLHGFVPGHVKCIKSAKEEMQRLRRPENRVVPCHPFLDSLITDAQRDLVLATYNVRSLMASAGDGCRFKDILADPDTHCVHAMHLCETRVACHQVSIVPGLKGAPLQCTAAVGRNPYGSMIVQKQPGTTAAGEETDDGIELCCSTIPVPHTASHIGLIGVYRSPSKGSIKVLCDAIRKVLQRLSNMGFHQVVIMGDFNIARERNVSDHMQLTQAFKPFGIVRCETGPTTMYGTCIDHIWSNLDRQRCTVHVGLSYFSDHRPVYLIYHRQALPPRAAGPSAARPHLAPVNPAAKKGGWTGWTTQRSLPCARSPCPTPHTLPQAAPTVSATPMAPPGRPTRPAPTMPPATHRVPVPQQPPSAQAVQGVFMPPFNVTAQDRELHRYATTVSLVHPGSALRIDMPNRPPVQVGLLVSNDWKTVRLPDLKTLATAPHLPSHSKHLPDTLAQLLLELLVDMVHSPEHKCAALCDLASLRTPRPGAYQDGAALLDALQQPHCTQVLQARGMRTCLDAHHIVAAVCTGTHYFLLHIQPPQPRLVIYDSLSTTAQPHHRQAAAAVKHALQGLAAQPGSNADWALSAAWQLRMAACPQQGNGHDCGIAAIMNAAHILSQTPLQPASYTPRDMALCRMALLAHLLGSHSAPWQPTGALAPAFNNVRTRYLPPFTLTPEQRAQHQAIISAPDHPNHYLQKQDGSYGMLRLLTASLGLTTSFDQRDLRTLATSDRGRTDRQLMQSNTNVNSFLMHITSLAHDNDCNRCLLLTTPEVPLHVPTFRAPHAATAAATPQSRRHRATRNLESPLDAHHLFTCTNTGVHFVLLHIQPPNCTITVYDSLQTTMAAEHRVMIRNVKQLLQELQLRLPCTKHWGPTLTGPDAWEEAMGASPQQQNSYDCGIFSILNAAHCAVGLQPAYSQQDIPDARVQLMMNVLELGT
jgi:DNA replication protein DnaC